MHCYWPRALRFPNQRIESFTEEHAMLYWSLVFLVVALVAGMLGFTGIYAAAAGIAQILFYVFLVLFIVSLVAGGFNRRTPI
jgi:uncharacterized membrane protein YtjA (UPF0391 family)